MQPEFKQVDFNQRHKFLQKQRQNKNALEREEQRQRKVVKMQAVIRAAIVRIRTFKQILDDAASGLPVVEQKQKGMTPEKAAKLMARVVYNMPHFFQAMLAINRRNYRHHEPYLVKLMELLSLNVGTRSPVLRCIVQKDDGIRWQVTKMVDLALRIQQAAPNTVCMRFLQSYMEECEQAQASDRFGHLLKNQELRRIIPKIVIRQGQDPQLSTLLNHTVIQHTRLFEFLSIEQCIMLALCDTQVVNDEFMQLPTLKPPYRFEIGRFLQKESLSTLRYFYLQSTKLLEQALLPAQISQHKLSFALLLNNLTLHEYGSAVKQAALSRFYHRRNTIETEQNRQQLQWVLRQSVQYTSFIGSINPRLYSDKLLQILNSLLGTKEAMDVLAFEPLVDLYIKILQVFRQTYTDSLSGQGPHRLVQTLFEMLNASDRLPSNRALDKYTQLLIPLLERQFKLMGDYEFMAPCYPGETLRKIIVFLKQQLCKQLFANQKSRGSPFLQSIIELLANIYKKNFRTRLLDPSIFLEELHLNRLFQGSNEDKKLRELLSQLKSIPFVISLEYRYQEFLDSIYEARIRHYQDAHVVTIERGNEFLSAFYQIGKMDLNHRFQFDFEYRGFRELGVDMGGPTKQFLSRVCKQVFNPNFGMFIETPSKELIPNPDTTFRDEHYTFAGQLIGRAVRDKVSIEPQFSGIFLNIILGERNTLEDLQYLNKEIYNNLIKLKHYEGNIEEWQLTFEIVSNQSRKIRPLREGGSNILVTAQNKMDYIADYADYLVNLQILPQSKAFRKGILTLLNEQTLKLFNFDELNRIVSGSRRNIDLADLQRHVVYCEYKKTDPTIVLFWEVMEQLTQEQREGFLLFVTACSRPPLLGFRQLEPALKIVKVANSDMLPMAQTCSNMLKLPDYENRQKLRDKLILAIHNNSGFGMA